MSGVVDKTDTKDSERNTARDSRLARAREPISKAPSNSPSTVTGMSKTSAETSSSDSSECPIRMCEYAEVSITSRCMESPPQNVVGHALRSYRVFDLREVIRRPGGITRQPFATSIRSDGLVEDLQHRGVHAASSLLTQPHELSSNLFGKATDCHLPAHACMISH